ncbi:MAG: hypothetical protein AAGJ35_14205, partial [Myxococcota bacterium]
MTETPQKAIMTTYSTPLTKGVAFSPSVAVIGSAGRIKQPPLCDRPEMREASTPFHELTNMVFRMKRDPQKESLSSCTSIEDPKTVKLCTTGNCDTPEAQEQILSKEHSRTGRETQRWFTDPETNQMYRLVTGCVPILKSGKILFVSSSRKAEWILPKGG